MEETAPKRSFIRRNYHWMIAGLMFLQWIVIAGLGNNCYSIYTIPVTEELGISRGAFSLASTFGAIPAFFANLIFAYFFNRFGHRKLASFSLVAVGLLYLLYAGAQSAWYFYVAASLMACVGVFYSTAGTSRLITDWFHRHQGLILGIVFAASGVGAALFSIILTAIIDTAGWRVSYAVTAGIFILFGVLTFLIVRNKPQEMGLEPFGEEHEGKAERKKHARNVQEWEGVPLSKLKRKPYFYLTLLGLFLVAYMTYIVYPTMVPHLQGMGMTSSQAAQIQSLMFIFLSIAKIIEGGLSDRFGAKAVMFLCVGCGIISSLMLAFVGSYTMAVAASAVFSMSLTVSTIMLPVLTSDVFGRHSYGTILGIVLAVIRIATGTAPTVANSSFDRAGTYVPVYLFAAAIGAVAVVLFIFAFIGSQKDKKALEAKEKTI